MTTNSEEKLPPIDGYVEYKGDPVEDALQRDSEIVLAIQKELVDEQRTLLQTSAGQKIQENKRRIAEIEMAVSPTMEGRITNADTGIWMKEEWEGKFLWMSLGFDERVSEYLLSQKCVLST